jgi:actin-related protein
MYNIPSVTYGIDSLFAYSRQKQPDGLAISLGNNASTVIPVVGGRGILSRAKRYVNSHISTASSDQAEYHGVELKRPS